MPLSVMFARGQAAFRDLDNGVKQAGENCKTISVTSNWRLRELAQSNQSHCCLSDMQESVKRGIEALAAAWQATRRIGLFSRNESKEDISTMNLKYVLTPYYLGEVSGGWQLRTAVVAQLVSLFAPA